MSEPSCNPTKPPTLDIALNGSVHSICEVLQMVMLLAAEAKIGALFSNTRKGEELHLHPCHDRKFHGVWDHQLN
eukprot:9813688-Ditylum_brightwellii.AAC.1